MGRARITVDTVAELAVEFPGVVEGANGGKRTWAVGKKAFAWERPFSKADVRRFGAVAPPAGEILALATEDLHEKEAILARGEPFFTIEHFNGYPAVLVRLEGTTRAKLRRALMDAWLVVAPPALAEEYLEAERARRRRS